MRVMLCITELEPGGAERALVTLAERLDRKHWEPVVCVLAGEPQTPRDALVIRLRKAGVPIYFLETRGVWDLPRTLGRFRRVLRTVQPAVIQTFLFHATMVATIGARLARWGAWGTKRNNVNIVNVPICTGIRVADRRAKGRLRAEQFVTKRWVSRVVCVSQGVADFSIENGWPEAKMLVIPNSVEIPEELGGADGDGNSDKLGKTVRRFPQKEEPLRVTAVGRLTFQKGFDWLLVAFARWVLEESRRVESPRNVTLRIVGAGEEEAKLRVITERLGIREQVKFLGWRPDVARILREETDLFVLSSRWEGMANVVLEAMALGLPILATDVEGVRELLDPEAIVPFGETERWVEQCREICNDPLRAEAMGRRNRTRVAVDYSVDTMVQRYEVLWETVWEENR